MNFRSIIIALGFWHPILVSNRLSLSSVSYALDTVPVQGGAGATYILPGILAVHRGRTEMYRSASIHSNEQI
ncbi:hypothetical protein BC629DRAFT_77786 [Irpex lacteus]|nr:hypothetical protein BC629DRAFT_77786 [Irpex lacteus]